MEAHERCQNLSTEIKIKRRKKGWFQNFAEEEKEKGHNKNFSEEQKLKLAEYR